MRYLRQTPKLCVTFRTVLSNFPNNKDVSTSVISCADSKTSSVLGYFYESYKVLRMPVGFYRESGTRTGQRST